MRLLPPAGRDGLDRRLVGLTLAAGAALIVGCHAESRRGSHAVASPASAPSAFANEPLVDLSSVDPRIVIDMRYATPNNFLKRAVYSDTRCFVRRTVALRLRAVQDDLVSRGLGLVVFDGYRPLRVQREMWRIMPNPNYVADPATGSRHNRGAAVDAALVDRAGSRLPMPTDFDDFTPASHRDAQAGDPAARANRDTLTRVMQSHGFAGLPTEWWHFDIEEWREYPIVTDEAEAARLMTQRRDPHQ